MPTIPNSPHAKDFARFLGRVMRRARGKAKAASIAYDMGVTQQAMSAWETGKVLPTLANLILFTHVVNYPLWRIIVLAERAQRMSATFAKDATSAHSAHLH